MDRGLRIYAYWVTTALTALLFAVPGTLLLAKQPHFGAEMARLGYPPYLLAILGSLKILGALVVLAPRLKRLKEWAYAGMALDVVGAVFSHAAVGDEPTKLIVPVAIGAGALASWALRPPTRALSSAQPHAQVPQCAPAPAGVRP
jgi:uncharacterized membrane protein YphA (DoxX/SURF4 family)